MSDPDVAEQAELYAEQPAPFRRGTYESDDEFFYDPQPDDPEPVEDAMPGREAECVMCGLAVWTFGDSDVCCTTCEKGW